MYKQHLDIHGSGVEYTVDIVNKGTIPAKISKIRVKNNITGNDAIKIEGLEVINEGHTVIQVGGKCNIHFTVKWDVNFSDLTEDQKTVNYTLEIEYAQDEENFDGQVIHDGTYYSLLPATTTFSGETSTASLPVTVNVDVDLGESVNLVANESKYVLTTSSDYIGTSDESLYSGGTFTDKTDNVTLTIDELGTYYLHTLSIGSDGDKKETVSSPITVAPVYHEHIGDVKDGGECYTTEIAHEHTNSCYHTLKSTGSTSFECTICGKSWTAANTQMKNILMQAQATIGCPVACPAGGDETMYELTCTKIPGETLEGYSVSY